MTASGAERDVSGLICTTFPTARVAEVSIIMIVGFMMFDVLLKGCLKFCLDIFSWSGFGSVISDDDGDNLTEVDRMEGLNAPFSL